MFVPFGSAQGSHCIGSLHWTRDTGSLHWTHGTGSLSGAEAPNSQMQFYIVNFFIDKSLSINSAKRKKLFLVKAELSEQRRSRSD